VDIWAVGVIAFTLLSGREPFGDGKKTQEDIKNSIRNDEPNYERLYGFSDDAVEFVKHCLHKDSTLRLTAEELLNTAWITDH